jgi:mannose-1-phosphate guanylyltransferase
VFAEDPDGVLALLPSDHLCQDEARLAAAIRLLVDHLGPAAIGLVATPTTVVAPAFGHVRPGPAVASGHAGEIAPVAGYVEKPRSAADLGEGSWLRNMGIVVGRARTLLDAAPAPVAEAAIGLVAGDTGALDAWAALDADRIEDVVLPGNRALMVASTPVEWIDVGTWPALFERADVEPSGNLTDGVVTVTAGTGNVVMSTGAQVAAIGVDDLLIVSTPEQVLVCAREYADRVRAVLAPG